MARPRPAEFPTPLRLSEERFVEAVGRYFQSRGVPRIGGRILGLLTLAEGPVSHERISELLQVSRASVSTNLKQFVASGLVQHVTFPGDRRQYYVYARDAWLHGLQRTLDGLREMAGLFSHAHESLPADRVSARERLRDSMDFCAFMDHEIAGAIARWTARSATRPGKRSPVNRAS